VSEPEYGGFWIRLGATIIDQIILAVVLIPPTVFIYGWGAWAGDPDQMVLGLWDILLNIVFPAIVVLWFWMHFAATPGKIIYKLKIVDAKTGGELLLGQAIGRYFAYIPAFIPLGIGLFWIGIDKKKQGWHDKLAGTLVIRNRPLKQVIPVDDTFTDGE